jgi:hypothetical protein
MLSGFEKENLVDSGKIYTIPGSVSWMPSDLEDAGRDLMTEESGFRFLDKNRTIPSLASWMPSGLEEAGHDPMTDEPGFRFLDQTEPFPALLVGCLPVWKMPVVNS